MRDFAAMVVLLALLFVPLAHAEPTTLQRVAGICDARVSGCAEALSPIVPAAEPAAPEPETAPEEATTTAAAPEPETLAAEPPAAQTPAPVTSATAPPEPKVAAEEAAPAQTYEAPAQAENDAPTQDAPGESAPPAGSQERLVAIAGILLAIVSVLILLAVIALPLFQDPRERPTMPRRAAMAMQADIDATWRNARG